MVDLAISSILSLLMSSSVDFSIPAIFCSFPAKRKWHNLVRTYPNQETIDHLSCPSVIHFLKNYFLFSKGRKEENSLSTVLFVWKARWPHG